jgi:transcriptional regulator with XRE-family HTH domain
MKTNDSSQIGTLIVAERKKKKIRQNQLARIIGCSTNHLCQIENGNKHPSLELLEKIFDVLEIRAYNGLPFFTDSRRAELLPTLAIEIERLTVDDMELAINILKLLNNRQRS